jgi:hypothetical protein
MRENFMSGIDEGRQDKPCEACFLLYLMALGPTPLRRCRNFVEIIKRELGMNAKGRRISGTDEESGLREPQASYSNDFDAVDRLIQLTSDKLPKYLRLAGRTTP